MTNSPMGLVFTFAGTVGLVAVIVGGVFVADFATPPHEVLVDNGNAFAVEVDIGSKHLTVAPHGHGSVRVRPGTLEVKAIGPGFVDRASIEMPDKGWNDTGRTAVYNVGGRSQLAVVTMTYGTVPGAHSSPIKILPRSHKLTLLPVGVYGAIDEAFPKSVKSKGSGVTVTRVCHVDVENKSVACPNGN